MQVRTNTWHYWFFAKAYKRDYSQPPRQTSLCTYFWTTLFSVLRCVGVTVFAVAMILVVLTTIISSFVTLYRDPSTSLQNIGYAVLVIGIMITCGLSIALVVVILKHVLLWLWSVGVIHLILGMPKIPVPPHYKVMAVPAHKRKVRRKFREKKVYYGWSFRTMPVGLAFLTCYVTISSYCALGAYLFDFPVWQGLLVPTVIVYAVLGLVVALSLVAGVIFLMLVIAYRSFSLMKSNLPALPEDSFVVLGLGALKAIKSRICPIIKIVDV